MTAAFLYRFTLAVIALPAGLAHSEPSAAEKNLFLYTRGVFAELEGDLTSAREHYEATLAGDGSSFQVARKTADLQLLDHDLPKAARTLRDYADEQPDHLSSHLYYADFLEQHASRDPVAQQTAAELLIGANERFPNHSQVFSRLINLHENAGDRDKSLAVFNAQFDALDAGPTHWMSLAPIAKTLLPSESPELAAKLDLIVRKTVETGVGIEVAARSASDYYRKTGRLEKAIAVLQKHLEFQPDSLAIRTRLGLLQFSAKQDHAALQTLEETLDIDPDQVLAHRALAQFFARHDEPEKALDHNAEVLRVAGGSSQDFLDLADQYLELMKPHAARLLLERARFDHPENPALAGRLAIATLRDGDPTTAARLFRQTEALAKDSKDPSAREYLDADFQLEFANSLQQAGDLAAAESRLREAIRGIPPDQPVKSARALRALARLWIDQKKNLAPAVSLLKRAQTLDPDNTETNKLLERARGE
jgi:tetratricopeptide (TPR) repeat protein